MMGADVTIHETRLPRRLDSLHYAVETNKPLTFPLIFGVDDSKDAFDRFDMAAVAGWLLGHQQYKWLMICQNDMELFRYRCLITSLKPISVGSATVAFEATVQCDGPYAYLVPYTNTIECTGATTTALHHCRSNLNTWYSPDLEIEYPQATNEIKIKNDEDLGREFVLSDLTQLTSHVIHINGRNMTASLQDGTLITNHTNFNFPRMVPGSNHLTITGTCTVKIISSPPINIGA